VRSVADDEVRTTIENDSGRSALHLDNKRDQIAGPRVQRRDVRLVIGDPPGRARAGHEAPGIDEIRIEVRGLPWNVGDQVCDRVRVFLGGTPSDGRSSEEREDHRRRDQPPRRSALAHGSSPLREARFPTSLFRRAIGATEGPWYYGRGWGGVWREFCAG
jgi:hypothetical protein